MPPSRSRRSPALGIASRHRAARARPPRPAVAHNLPPGLARCRLIAAAWLILVGLLRSGWPAKQLGRSSPGRVMVMPFEALTASENAGSLARQYPQRNSQPARGQPDRSPRWAERVRRKHSTRVCTARHRDPAGRRTRHECGRPDRGRPNACCIMVDTIQASQRSSLGLAARGRRASYRRGQHDQFARGANPPLTDRSALSALLQTTDMIRDAHGGAWAQMLEHAQGIVARHPDFAFGHDVLAYAYGWRRRTLMFPIAPAR